MRPPGGSRRLAMRPTPRRCCRTLVLAGGLLLAGTAQAGAATYCVAPETGCGGGDHATIASALTAASGTPAADDVRLGGITYNDGPWSYSDPTGTNPVT